MGWVQADRENETYQLGGGSDWGRPNSDCKLLNYQFKPQWVFTICSCSHSFLKDDHLLHLATAVRGGNQHGFSNGQSKAITMELVNIVRLHGLCKKRRARLNVYVHIIAMFYTFTDHCGVFSSIAPSRTVQPIRGGVKVEVDILTAVTPPASESDSEVSGSSQPTSQSSQASQPTGAEPCFLSDTIILKVSLLHNFS